MDVTTLINKINALAAITGNKEISPPTLANIFKEISNIIAECSAQADLTSLSTSLSSLQKSVSNKVEKDGNKVLSDKNFSDTHKSLLELLDTLKVPTIAFSISKPIKITSELSADGAWTNVKNGIYRVNGNGTGLLIVSTDPTASLQSSALYIGYGDGAGDTLTPGATFKILRYTHATGWTNSINISISDVNTYLTELSWQKFNIDNVSEALLLLLSKCDKETSDRLEGDTGLLNLVERLRSDMNSLLSGDVTSAIDNLNEVISFLEGVTDDQKLSGLLTSIQGNLNNKVTQIPGKGLSTNDFTNDLKTLLSTLDTLKVSTISFSQAKPIVITREVSNDFTAIFNGIYRTSDNNNSKGILIASEDPDKAAVTTSAIYIGYGNVNGFTLSPGTEYGMWICDKITGWVNLSDKFLNIHAEDIPMNNGNSIEDEITKIKRDTAGIVINPYTDADIYNIASIDFANAIVEFERDIPYNAGALMGLYVRIGNLLTSTSFPSGFDCVAFRLYERLSARRWKVTSGLHSAEYTPPILNPENADVTKLCCVALANEKSIVLPNGFRNCPLRIDIITQGTRYTTWAIGGGSGDTVSPAVYDGAIQFTTIYKPNDICVAHFVCRRTQNMRPGQFAADFNGFKPYLAIGELTNIYVNWMSPDTTVIIKKI